VNTEASKVKGIAGPLYPQAHPSLNLFKYVSFKLLVSENYRPMLDLSLSAVYMILKFITR